MTNENVVKQIKANISTSKTQFDAQPIFVTKISVATKCEIILVYKYLLVTITFPSIRRGLRWYNCWPKFRQKPGHVVKMGQNRAATNQKWQIVQYWCSNFRYDLNLACFFAHNLFSVKFQSHCNIFKLKNKSTYHVYLHYKTGHSEENTQ